MSAKRPPLERHADPYKNARPAKREPRPAPPDLDDGGPAPIEGRNAVLEALRAGLPLDKVYLARGDDSASLGNIASRARAAGAVVVDADRRKLDQMSVTHAHQGVIALLSAAEYVEVSDILALAAQRGEPPLLVVCDEISDPHNLGAIIRTAEAAGAHGVVIPKRRSASLTATVAKTSAGAAFHLPTARVANLTSALRELKQAGVWLYGTAADGDKPLWETDFSGAAAIVVGSEGEGLGTLVRQTCDFMVRIPMAGRLASLNASVSASLVLYEAVRQRRTQ